MIARYVRKGGRVHMCLYDLQKAFDSVPGISSAVEEAILRLE